MAKRRYENRANPDARSTCRECGKVTVLPRSHYFRAKTPRCMDCGGWLDLSDAASNDLARGVAARTENHRLRGEA